MKKLRKVLLINWLYYEKTLVNFDDINYITGKTGSGKTTFIDALQIVLLGELTNRNFNKAANDSSERTLKGYLRADMDDNNQRSRRGRSFRTYIAAEFLDDFTGRCFTIGVVFDCYNDGGERHQFFTFDGPIPDNCFIENREAMDIASLRKYIKEVYKSRGEMYDSNKKYRDAISAKWNVHTAQIFGMLKRAVSFRPIVDIQKFITENVCDDPDRPDIAAMQQNIQDYKHQELLAKKQEEKQAELQKISELYSAGERSLNRLRLHQYLIMRADVEIAQSNVHRLENERTDKTELLAELRAKYETLEQKETELGKRRDQLISDRGNSDVFKERERIEAQKNTLLSERSRLEKELDAVITDVRLEAHQWSAFCQNMHTNTRAGCEEIPPRLDAAAKALDQELKKVEKLKAEDFDNLDISVFESVQAAMRELKNSLDEHFYALDTSLSTKQNESDNNAASIEKLKRGVKDYPQKLIRLKQRIDDELLKRHGKNAASYILADLLEISDPQWQNAVEGYLNTQKFYILVEPAYYNTALQTLNSAKKSEDLYGYGLVDIGKLRENEKLRCDPNSLAAVVTTENRLARSYIDYLLGRVIRCEQLSELRQHKIAITADGMLYQGYVSRPLSSTAMSNWYIGSGATKKRLAVMQEAQTDCLKEIATLSSRVKSFRKYKEKDPLFTERYVQSVLRDGFVKRKRLTVLSDELATLEVAYEKLDLTWLARLNDLIEEASSARTKCGQEREVCAADIKVCETRIHQLEYEDLPEKYQLLHEKTDKLEETFSDDYARSTGEPRWIEELARLKTPKTIYTNFTASYSQSTIQWERDRRSLVLARREYVNAYPPCRFIPDANDNDEFAAELKRLSESELPLYREKIQKARESAFEQFQNDFLAKLKSNIDSVESQVKELNRALQKAQFGTDQYRFIVGRHPDYADYYTMIKDPDLMEDGGGIFSYTFQNRYGTLIEDLFGKIVASDDIQLNARRQSELSANIERFTDYRTYLHFDLETTDQNGNVQMLSKTLNTKSGGETQTPFYIAVLASFAQIYRIHDASAYGNTMRLVLFDEAFNKMDSERIIESIRLLRKMNLQAIICTPPDKLPDIMPVADKTLLVIKEKYDMQVVPYSKELEALIDE